MNYVKNQELAKLFYHARLVAYTILRYVQLSSNAPAPVLAQFNATTDNHKMPDICISFLLSDIKPFIEQAKTTLINKPNSDHLNFKKPSFNYTLTNLDGTSIDLNNNPEYRKWELTSIQAYPTSAIVILQHADTQQGLLFECNVRATKPSLSIRVRDWLSFRIAQFH